MSKIYLVTHGETRLDREGRIHGQKVDASLSDAGKATAKRAAKQLQGKGIDCLYCSPLKRAKETAQIIAKQIGAKVEPREELLPWDVASMSGAKVGSIKPLLDFFSARPDKPIPGGESKSAFLKRYKGFMDEMRQDAKKESLGIVGHSQHSLGLSHVLKGGDMAKVPVLGGKPGEVKTISV